MTELPGDCLCVHTDVFTWMCSHRCVHMDVFTQMCSHGCVHTDVFTWMCSHRCVHMDVFTQMCSHGCVHTDVFTWMWQQGPLTHCSRGQQKASALKGLVTDPSDSLQDWQRWVITTVRQVEHRSLLANGLITVSSVRVHM